MKKNLKTIFKKVGVLGATLIGNILMFSNYAFAEGIREEGVQAPKGTLEGIANITSVISYVLIAIVVVALIIFYIWWKKHQE